MNYLEFITQLISGKARPGLFFVLPSVLPHSECSGKAAGSLLLLLGLMVSGALHAGRR